MQRTLHEIMQDELQASHPIPDNEVAGLLLLDTAFDDLEVIELPV